MSEPTTYVASSENPLCWNLGLLEESGDWVHLACMYGYPIPCVRDRITHDVYGRLKVTHINWVFESGDVYVNVLTKPDP